MNSEKKPPPMNFSLKIGEILKWKAALETDPMARARAKNENFCKSAFVDFRMKK